MNPVTPERIEIAKAYGLTNVETIATVCRKVGIPFFAACALFEKESGGRNVFGHDAGGALSGYPGPVNKHTYAVFRWLVFEKGQTSNGVGPSQITYKGFFENMEEDGLKPWKVEDNMYFGLSLLWGYYLFGRRDWVYAGKRYNGAESYGIDLANKVYDWRVRLKVGQK